jgi:hypothetical protein
MDVGSQGRQAALLRHAEQGAEISRIAEAATTLWQEVDRALSPIIGALGVTSIYKRSVNLLRAHYPWLQGAYAEADDGDPFAVLKSALEQQSPTIAATANGALLQAFYNLLENLIGDALTDRLLRAALHNHPTNAAIQEIES